MHKTIFRTSIVTVLLACFTVAMVSAPVAAQDTSVRSLLKGASDGALDKLAKPGAFYADEAIRIVLPGPLEKASKLLKLTGKSGLTKDLTKSMNEVASLAAKEAKPIFSKAIDELSVKDGVNIVKEKGGATKSLRESSGDSLREKIRPLVSKAMGDAGTFDQLNKLNSIKAVGKLGVSDDSVADHVTKKTMDGIFKYMAAEEDKVRKNPLKALGGLLKK